MQTSVLSPLIPADRIPAVEKALLQTFNTRDIQEIRLLAGGFSSSAVFKIVIDSQPYVLKLDMIETLTVENPISNIKELTCAEIAADAGIAPPLYYLNTADALSITGFIENKPLRTVFTSSEILLGELARTIRSIHTMPRFPKENDLLKTVESFILQVKGSSMFTKSIFENFFEYYDQIRSAYPWHDQDKVPSHNDLNPNNMLCNGKKIWVVDWDAAFMNDRYVDLAITANFFVTNEAQEKIFLEVYFGDTFTIYNSARFFIMRQICRLIYAILMFKLAYNTDPVGPVDDPEIQTITLRQVGEQMVAGRLSLTSYRGQLLYGKALLNEALMDMRSSRFMNSVELLSNASPIS